jgi:hypothetical protein
MFSISPLYLPKRFATPSIHAPAADDGVLRTASIYGLSSANLQQQQQVQMQQMGQQASAL